MFLWHFPSGRPAPPLAGILSGEARTFLSPGRSRGSDRPATLHLQCTTSGGPRPVTRCLKADPVLASGPAMRTPNLPLKTLAEVRAMTLPQISIDLMEAYTVLRPLGIAVVGMAVYGVFVFNFYRFLARKDIFRLDLEHYNNASRPFVRKSTAVLLYVLKFLVLFPAFVFFWFAVIALLLSVMARNQSVDSVLLAAMSVVGAVRVSAYYNVGLSTDLAKILPFALLGILLIDRTLVQIPTSAMTIQEAATHWETMVYYLGAVVAMEFVLRMMSWMYGLIRGGRSDRSEAQAAAEAGPERVPEPLTRPAVNGARSHSAAGPASDPGWGGPPVDSDDTQIEESVRRPRLPLVSPGPIGRMAGPSETGPPAGDPTVETAAMRGEDRFDRLMRSLEAGRPRTGSGRKDSGPGAEATPFDTLGRLRAGRRG